MSGPDRSGGCGAAACSGKSGARFLSGLYRTEDPRHPAGAGQPFAQQQTLHDEGAYRAAVLIPTQPLAQLPERRAVSVFGTEKSSSLRLHGEMVQVEVMHPIMPKQQGSP